MTTYEDLTDSQKELHDTVAGRADWTGEDYRAVLIRTDGTQQDKAACAAVWGGPEAAAESQR